MHRRQPRQPPQLSSRSLRQHTILHWRGDVRLVVGSPQAQVLHCRIFKRLQALAQTQWPYVLGSAHSHAWRDHDAAQRHCALPVVMWDHVASAVRAREPRRSGTTPTQQHSRSSEAGNALARDGCGRRTTPAVSQPETCYINGSGMASMSAHMRLHPSTSHVQFTQLHYLLGSSHINGAFGLHFRRVHVDEVHGASRQVAHVSLAKVLTRVPSLRSLGIAASTVGRRQ